MTPGCHPSSYRTIAAGAFAAAGGDVDPVLRLLKRRLVDLAAVAVLLLEDLGKTVGQGVVGADQELDRPGGVAHPPDGVDAGGEDEDDLPGGDLSGFDAGAPEEGLHPRPRGAVDLLEADLRDHAVLPDQGDDVRGGRQRREIQVPERHVGLPKPIRDSLDQFEPDAATAEALEGVPAIPLQRVEHGEGVRQDFRRLVVIADDDFQSP